MKLFCRTVLRRSIFAIMLLLLLPSSAWAQEPEAVESATEAEDDEPRNEGRMGRRLRLLFKNSTQNSDANSEETEDTDDDESRSKRKERKNRDTDASAESDNESDSADLQEESGESVYYEDAHLEFDETVWDFGDVARKGGDVVKVFEFVNDGSKPLLITGITMSCTCIKVDYPKRPVAAGKRGAIKLIYEPHKMSPGTFYRVVQVHSNSVDGIRLLTVSGNSVDARRLD